MKGCHSHLPPPKRKDETGRTNPFHRSISKQTSVYNCTLRNLSSQRVNEENRVCILDFFPLTDWIQNLIHMVSRPYTKFHLLNLSYRVHVLMNAYRGTANALAEKSTL
ncbi:hypothetical protein AVEN_224706-1 [Araneus ventricosus]|uniref:Uncharacterized protein n=1 Tax=Araneus ventricosus TaxID=182803 RepID=A0A4Y2EVK2_ARAVE|nr:hypothetical protein AVEN_224706-1 [Araneus ventricosus]